MKLKDLYAQTVSRLNDLGIETSELDARLLLSHTYGLSYEAFLREDNQDVDAQKAEPLIKRRLLREPVSKITGEKGFWDYVFYTNQHTLDPRPDSETLIDVVLKKFPDKEMNYDFLDLGTGTGCLLQTLLLEYKNAKGIGVDISKDALDVFKRNRERHDLENRCAALHKSFNDDDFGFDHKFDLVISNPPYIKSAEIESLLPDVKNHDPLFALDGGHDGLDPYRNIIRLLPTLLKSRGWVVFEIGRNQEKDVQKMLLDSGLQAIDMTRDFGNVIRCVFARNP